VAKRTLVMCADISAKTLSPISFAIAEKYARSCSDSFPSRSENSRKWSNARKRLGDCACPPNPSTLLPILKMSQREARVRVPNQTLVMPSHRETERDMSAVT
jgi:hypothetical protein